MHSFMYYCKNSYLSLCNSNWCSFDKQIIVASLAFNDGLNL